jgi:formylmethanofuran dehydrogenase subunit C
MRVTLKFKDTHFQRLDVSALQPLDLLGKPLSEIEQTVIRVVGKPIELAEVCSVRVSQANEDELILSGDTTRLCAAGRKMTGGKLIIEGDTGDEIGLAMMAGTIFIKGNVGDWCGAHEVGKLQGMRGGMIFVQGHAGNQAGACMRGGLIFVEKNLGNYAGARMKAGTILCSGRVGDSTGVGMRRGSIVANQGSKLLPGFNLAEQADIEWLRLYATQLRKTGIGLPAKWLNEIPLRFTGDHLEMGKGEILLYG